MSGSLCPDLVINLEETPDQVNTSCRELVELSDKWDPFENYLNTTAKFNLRDHIDRKLNLFQFTCRSLDISSVTALCSITASTAAAAFAVTLEHHSREATEPLEVTESSGSEETDGDSHGSRTLVKRSPPPPPLLDLSTTLDSYRKIDTVWRPHDESL